MERNWPDKQLQQDNEYNSRNEKKADLSYGYILMHKMSGSKASLSKMSRSVCRTLYYVNWGLDF